MKNFIVKTILFGFLGLLFYFIVLPLNGYIRYTPKEGDIIFQSLPKMDLVIAIEGITNSPYSHVGVVIYKKDEWFVREAIGGVLDTPLWKWVLRGRQGSFDVYRFNNIYSKNIASMIHETEKYMGLPYDIKYKMDDEKIYCSELIYKAYKDATGDEIAQLVVFGTLNWKPYKNTIEYYEEGDVPLERVMITPKDLAKSKYLEQVFSGYLW